MAKKAKAQFIVVYDGGVPRAAHVATVRDGETMRYYTDGKLAAEEWKHTGGRIVIFPIGNTAEVEHGRQLTG